MDIYKDISEYVTRMEFQKQQGEFYQKNYDAFEDTEENKLEYTNIHASYMYIIDEMIEAKLKEKYT